MGGEEVEVFDAAADHSRGDQSAPVGEGDGGTFGQFGDNGPDLALEVCEYRQG